MAQNRKPKRLRAWVEICEVSVTVELRLEGKDFDKYETFEATIVAERLEFAQKHLSPERERLLRELIRMAQRVP